MMTLVLQEEADAKQIDDISEETFNPDKQVSSAMLKRWKLILDLYKDFNFL